MRKFAQIQENIVHLIFEQEDVPVFAPNIQIVEITGIDPLPQEGWLYENGALIEPKVDIVEFKKMAVASIDVAAGNARTRYITSVPGQELLYMTKTQQAKEFVSNDYSGIPPLLVSIDMQISGLSAKETADLIIAKNIDWETKAAEIESVRLKAKFVISACDDYDVALFTLNDALDKLNSI